MEYKQKYSRGKPVTKLTKEVLPDEQKDRKGTCIRFWPDKDGLLSFKELLHVTFNNSEMVFMLFFWFIYFPV